MRRIIIVVILSISGCSSLSVSQRDAMEVSGSKAAQACCKSVAELTGSESLSAFLSTEFAPEHPHFDFGTGLVPFKRYSVPSSYRGKTLELFASSPGTGLLMGGDGRLRYVVLKAKFVTADSSIVEPKELVMLGVRNYRGNYNLGRAYLIPGNAEFVVIYSDRTDAGSVLATSSVSSQSMTMINGVAVPIGGVRHDIGYKSMVYGPFALSVSGG